jgi:hypothetical protein
LVEIYLLKWQSRVTAPVRGASIGRHAVYFVFSSEAEGPAAELDRFTFD